MDILSRCIALTVYAASFKLAARLVGRSVITWKSTLSFAVAVGLVSVVGKAVFHSLGTFHGIELPVALVLAGSLHFVAGTWFLRKFGETSGGRPLHGRRTIEIAALAVAIFLAVALALRAVARIALHHAG
jgi:hypothetical protein